MPESSLVQQCHGPWTRTSDGRTSNHSLGLGCMAPWRGTLTFQGFRCCPCRVFSCSPPHCASTSPLSITSSYILADTRNRSQYRALIFLYPCYRRNMRTPHAFPDARNAHGCTRMVRGYSLTSSRSSACPHISVYSSRLLQNRLISILSFSALSGLPSTLRPVILSRAPQILPPLLIPIWLYIVLS